MDLVFQSLIIAIGLLALVFDRKVANAVNCFSIAIGQLFPAESKWPTVLPPWSRERCENDLWFVRLWAVYMIAVGMLPLLGVCILR
jgi:hypothetical protein